MNASNGHRRPLDRLRFGRMAISTEPKPLENLSKATEIYVPTIYGVNMDVNWMTRLISEVTQILTHLCKPTFSAKSVHSTVRSECLHHEHVGGIIIDICRKGSW